MGDPWGHGQRLAAADHWSALLGMTAARSRRQPTVARRLRAAARTERRSLFFYKKIVTFFI
jgi:hypothetical protein